MLETATPERTAGGEERPAFRVTAKAAGRAAALIAAERSRGAGGDLMLRLQVHGGGCSGYQYGFVLDAAANEDDTVFEREGARIVVDACSLDLLAGAELDWVETLAGAAFHVSNPNAASSCGCGSSFSV